MAVLKNKDVQKLSKEDSVKKISELERSLLEMEKFTQKRNPVKKAIARLKTHLHNLEAKSSEKPKKLIVAKKAKVKKEVNTN